MAGHNTPLTISVTACVTESSPAKEYSLLRSSRTSTNLAGNQPKTMHHNAAATNVTCISGIIWAIHFVVDSFARIRLSIRLSAGNREVCMYYFTAYRTYLTLVTVQFSNPAMIVFLWNNGNDVIGSESQFVVVPPFKVQKGSRTFSLWSRNWHVNFMVPCMALRRIVRLRKENWMNKKLAINLKSEN